MYIIRVYECILYVYMNVCMVFVYMVFIRVYVWYICKDESYKHYTYINICINTYMCVYGPYRYVP